MDPRRAAFTAFSIANQMLAGPVGDSVRATFRDGTGRAQTVSIVRGREPGTMAKFGNLPPFPASLTHERVQQGGKTVGIIRFNIWMPVLSPQFDAAVDSLRDADAIIIDVRGNFGGVGGMSMGVAGHFLDSSLTIGTMQQRGVSLKFVANPRRVDTRSRGVTPFAGPVALLVDELSVSTTRSSPADCRRWGGHGFSERRRRARRCLRSRSDSRTVIFCTTPSPTFCRRPANPWRVTGYDPMS